MTLIHYRKPEAKVEADSTEYQSETAIVDVFLPENAVSIATLIMNDYQGKNFLNNLNVRDELKVYFRYKDHTPTWTQVFGGYITKLVPTIDTRPGQLLSLMARGYGQALTDMVVTQEYGTESANPTLNTLSEILTDADAETPPPYGKGIIPKYVNEILSGGKAGTNSGYNIDTSKVGSITSDLRYLYFPQKPAFDCLRDICDLVTAANAGSAGPHFIVDPSKRLLVATVGNHENPPADVWPTWFNTDQANSTIEEGTDIKSARFTKLQSEANYILYYGKLHKPVDLDIWTNVPPAGVWDCDYGSMIDDTSYYIVGDRSFRWASDLVLRDESFWYPASKDLALDVTAMGGKYNVPALNLWWRRLAGAGASPTIRLRFVTGIGNYFQTTFTTDDIMPAYEFYNFNLPIGNHWKNANNPNFPGWVVTGSPSWNNINWIQTVLTVVSTSQQIYFWTDGMHFSGHIARAAKDSSLITGDKCKIKTIVDHIGKDDSCNASDDSGVMAQFAYASLLRSSSKPLVGQITLPGHEEIKPGQLCHVHFGKKADGTFNIDKDMRILQHHLHLGSDGYLSILDVTDDVTNSQARTLSVMNNLLQAVNPSFRNREVGSQKSRDIDITQTILEKAY